MNNVTNQQNVRTTPNEYNENTGQFVEIPGGVGIRTTPEQQGTRHRS
jgi:hypothetical protein